MILGIGEVECLKDTMMRELEQPLKLEDGRTDGRSQYCGSHRFQFFGFICPR